MLANPITSLFGSWYHQTAYDASLLTSHCKRQVWPLLFFKPIPAQDWIAFAAAALTVLRPHGSTIAGNRPWWPHLWYDWLDGRQLTMNVSHGRKKVNVSLDLGTVVICRWKDFASNVVPESIIHGVPDLQPANQPAACGTSTGDFAAGNPDSAGTTGPAHGPDHQTSQTADSAHQAVSG